MIDTIICGDCLEVLEEMPDNYVDAIITDPPYSSGARRDANANLRQARRRGEDKRAFSNDTLTSKTFAWFMRACGLQWARVLKPDGHLLIFIDWYHGYNIANALETAGLKQVNLVVWDKQYFGMGHYFRNQHELILHFLNYERPKPFAQNVGNVISIKPIRNGIHPTEKPVELIERMLPVVTNEYDTVLDPFAGSGTIAVACRRSNRHYICIEKEPEYCAIAEKRIAEML
jgi:site-specific DNA-methyltransferase (adenine-specific)